MNFEPLLNYKKIMEELTLTTPTLLFSAVSLILLAYTNRFLSYAQLVRQLRDRYVENPSDITEAQIENLRKRLNLTRTMQGLGIASLFLCVVSMFLIYIGLQLFSAYVFGLALILLIASLGVSFREIQISHPFTGDLPGNNGEREKQEIIRLAFPSISFYQDTTRQGRMTVKRLPLPTSDLSSILPPNFSIIT